MEKYKIKVRLIINLLFVSFAFSTIVNAADNLVNANAQKSQTSIFSKEKWGVSYFNYMNEPTFQQAEGGSINHYFTLKHKFNPNWYLSGIFQPDSNITNGSSIVTMGDSYLQLGYPAITEFAGGKIYGQVRYFLPLSEKSRTAEIAGVVSTRLYAQYETGPWHFTYVFIPKAYVNTREQEGQKILSQHHWLQANFDVIQSFTIDMAVYPGWTYSRGKSGEFNNLLAYPGFTAKFSKDLALSPYMEIPLMNMEGKSTSIGASLSYTLL